MDCLTKEQFKKKWLHDASVKNFIVNNEISKKLNKRGDTKFVTTNNRAKDLVPSTTDKDIDGALKECLNDGFVVRRDEILSMEFKDLLSARIKLVEQKKDAAVNLNFTLGDFTKRIHERPDKVETIEVEVEDAEITD